MKTRHQVLIIFLISVLCGVPFWYETTTLERSIDYTVLVNDVHRLIEKRESIVREIVLNVFVMKGVVIDGFDAVFDGSDVVYVVNVEEIEEIEIEGDELDEYFDGIARGKDGYNLFLVGRDVESVEIGFGVGRNVWAIASVDKLKNAAEMLAEVLNVYFTGNEKHENLDLVKMKLSDKYELSFGLLNAEPESGVMRGGWNFEKIKNAYLGDVLDTFSIFADIEVTSKVIHFASLKKKPEYSESTNTHYFTIENLPYFIDYGTWRLDSTSITPVINFALYTPMEKYSPLMIKAGDYKEGFVIPQWGGVVINNNRNIQTVSISDMEEPIKLFLSQLRNLYGIPSIREKKSFYKNLILEKFNESINVNILESKKNGATQWEIDALIWENFNEYFIKTTDSLTHLSALLEKLDNIPVPSHIKDEVESAKSEITKSLTALSNNNAKQALQHAQKANTIAEKAFFDPDMMGMLYFPTEHKYAIYVPLFMPLTFPLFSGFMDWKNGN